MRNLADYYAGLPAPQEEPKVADAALIESGRKLAIEGVPEAGIPPCAACHGNPAGGAPRLAGQHAAYMAGQLRLLRMGHVPATAGAPLMAPIAQRLSDDQINAVSAYFASVPPQIHDAQLP